MGKHKQHLKMDSIEKSNDLDTLHSRLRKSPRIKLKSIQNQKKNNKKRAKPIFVEEVEEDVPFQCKIQNCFKIFSDNWNLTRHMKTQHGPPSFKCPICPMKFKDGSNMKSHQKTHEKTRPIFQCSSCPSKYWHRRDLTRHNINKHSGIVHKCLICSKVVSTSEILKKHVKIVHTINTEEMLIKCYFCKKGFNVFSDLVKHMRRHTGERPNEIKKTNEIEEIAKTELKFHQCKLCEKKFKLGVAMLDHMSKGHMFCYTCRKYFSWPMNIRLHELTYHK